MAVTLSSLIEDVQARTPSPDPLALLETAATTVEDINDTTDALLSHFVDKCRRAGHSWAEIGGSLGVTKQAVQKRFTRERTTPVGWERYTARAQRVARDLAPAAATALRHSFIGTEHLLLALLDEGKGVAAVALGQLGLTRESAAEKVLKRSPAGGTAPDQTAEPVYTPRAWTAMANTVQQAVELGHNYVGTEHLLLALLSGVGGVAADVLAEAGIDHETVRKKVTELLAGYGAGQKSDG